MQSRLCGGIKPDIRGKAGQIGVPIGACSERKDRRGKRRCFGRLGHHADEKISPCWRSLRNWCRVIL